MPLREQARLTIQAVHEAVAAAGRIVVLSGAGMSSESGIPTFRDAQTGLWARFDPMQLASAEGFRSDPRLVWDWYAQRRAGVRASVPNAGHLALARFAAAHPGRLHIITQNVDDLHQRAGSPDVIRLHGDILQSRWLDPCRELVPCDPATAEPGRPPHCTQCGNLLRPAVVWFGEQLPPDALVRAEGLARQCELMLVVGTSGTVYPAAGLASLARDAGAMVIIVNPHASDLDAVAHQCLRGTAAAVLPLLFE
ncbi:MAG: NAD-dependent deacylase [Burkholderiaceae bacterium]|nr:NAD-dependent deacylase [Burkholderiaceae bacterium]